LFVYLLCIKVRLSSVAAFETTDEPESLVKGNSDRHEVNSSVKGNSKDLGISNSSISKPSRVVLDRLKKEGFEVYLVGGCVRDLILKRTPRDFDIITSAELKEASICHVFVCVLIAVGVRTMIRAMDSFQQDCARILRAVRIAARLGFSFTHQTGHSITYLASSVLRLDKVRILMEMNYMLAYGSAEASLRLLWRYHVLEILLPIQAAYFVQQGFRRWDRRSNMLLSLFSTMDNLLAPDRPCHCSLWVGILAFHKALSDQPRDPLVVAAFCLAVHNGGDISEALNIARSISTPHDISFHELLQPQNLEVESLGDEVMNLAASVKNILTNMTDEHFVSKAISMTSMYPTAPYSDLVFISLDLYLRVCKMFECARLGKEKGFVAKQGSKIDYDLLALGSLQEVRHVFARVVFDTVFPLHLSQDHRPS
ncbi:hypothetical protein C3L33_14492, partial [Rhododendron williamsianum]